MKKIYALVAGLFLLGTVNAQITDGGFEGTFYPASAFGINSTNVGGYVSSGTTVDWMGILHNETTAPLTGAQSAVALSVSDTAAQNAFQFVNQEVPGWIQRVYKGSVPTIASSTTTNFTFNYKYTPTGTDTAAVMVYYIDTTKTASNGIVYLGVKLITSATTSATPATITTWNNVQAGTPNKVMINFISSYGAFMDDTPAPLGSKFTVDDVAVTYGSVGVDNASTVSSKVYPNPVNNVLNVEVSSDANTMNIYNLDGSLVKTVELNGIKSTVNVSDLNSGMYIYRISTKDGQEMKATFIKE